ncbi:hypothetical protein [Candidatus Poriferisodalis sp.]|uniref:hypothetical protein n=1 Tax=Candidatus Poriferisodalis sp. TaxID=3101277 RepID=UPI003C6FD7E5
MAAAVSLPISGELAERLRAEGQASGQPPPVLAASLLDEGLKTRQFPGIVYIDGPSGRRASLAGGPDIWQVIKALRGVPMDQYDPIETVCTESDLHERQVNLAIRFYETYPDEIEAKVADDLAAGRLIDEMIAERERSIALEQTGGSSRAKLRGRHFGQRH